MLDVLYFVGQVLFLLGLAYGACLAITTSTVFLAIREAQRERRRKLRRDTTESDPHGTELGYWP